MEKEIKRGASQLTPKGTEDGSFSWFPKNKN
jgi:hypothetical protein